LFLLLRDNKFAVDIDLSFSSILYLVDESKI